MGKGGQPGRGRAFPFSEVVRHRDFSLIWVGRTVSQVGNGAYQVALGWTVYRVTRSTADMGIALAANAIPQILLYLFGGVLGDRLPRRTIVLVADCVAGVATAGLAVAAVGGNLGFGGLLAGSGTLGVTAALYGPAYYAIVPDVLPRTHLLEGNTLLEVSGNLARVAGPLVAGITYAFGGAAITFGLDAASFMISAGCMALTVVPPTRVAYRGTVYRGIRDGIAYMGKTRWIQLVISVSLVANAVGAAPLLVLLPRVVQNLHGGPRSLGIALAVQTGTAVASGIIISRARWLERSGVGLMVLAGAIGLGVAVVGLARSLGEVLIGMAVIGVGYGFNIIENTVMQMLVPSALMSRVFSVNLAASYAFLPLGYAVSGVIAQSAGAATVMLAGGLFLLTTAPGSALMPAIRHLPVSEPPTTTLT
jgi:Transmembrane secretion effector